MVNLKAKAKACLVQSSLERLKNVEPSLYQFFRVETVNAVSSKETNQFRTSMQMRGESLRISIGMTQSFKTSIKALVHRYIVRFNNVNFLLNAVNTFISTNYNWLLHRKNWYINTRRLLPRDSAGVKFSNLEFSIDWRLLSVRKSARSQKISVEPIRSCFYDNLCP